MLKNIVWNIIAILAAGGVLAFFWLALPWLADGLLLLAAGGVVLLAVGFILVHVFGPKRGVRVGDAGILHNDIWRDD